MNSFLVTRPNHDLVTTYLYYWTQPLIDLAKEKGFVVYDLEQEKARKNLLESYLSKNNPQLIFFNGHGSKDKIAGINDEVLIEVNQNENLLADCIIYARSCMAAAVLGVSCIKKGAKVFIGYVRDFIVISSPHHLSRPLEDKIAAFFLEPSNLIVKSLLKGHSPQSSCLKSRKNSMKKIKYLLSNKATAAEKSITSFVWGNLQSLKLITDN